MYLVHKVHGMVKELISIAPQMMFIADGNGNYPLHIAIHNQQEYEVVRELFGAFPAVHSNVVLLCSGSGWFRNVTSFILSVEHFFDKK